MKYKIYTLEHPITGEIRYVGFTSMLLRKRYDVHIYRAKNNCDTTYSSNWIKSLLRAGLKPVIKFLDECDNDWQYLETFWISQFKTWGFRLTNLTDGGEGSLGYKASEKTRLINAKPVFQYSYTGVFLKKYDSIVDASKEIGICRSTIGKAANLNALSGGFLWSFKKERISLSKSSLFRCKILQYNLNGNFIKEWKGASEVQDELNIKSSNIAKVLRGQRKTAGGFIWKYIVSNEDIIPKKFMGERKVIAINNDNKIIFNNSREVASYFNVSFQLISLILNNKIKKSRKLKNIILSYE